jgi:hypothetical protein
LVGIKKTSKIMLILIYYYKLIGCHTHVVTVGDMPKCPSSQYGLKVQEDIDPKGIRVTNEPMR